MLDPPASEAVKENCILMQLMKFLRVPTLRAFAVVSSLISTGKALACLQHCAAHPRPKRKLPPRTPA